jgi:hypothetical protein
MTPVFHIKSANQLRSHRIAVIALALLLLTTMCAMTISCGASDDKRLTKRDRTIYDDPKYVGWEFYECGQVKLFHPPLHIHEAEFPTRCDMYKRSIANISELLDIPQPTDTLVVFTYTGYGQGRELTGKNYPFTEDSIIHFWIPSFLGPTLTDWMIPHWVPEPPKYVFWRHGLRALFDFSGQNYHRGVYDLIEKGTFIPLDSLVSDTAIDSDTERRQSAEAASFVAFVLGTYGPQSLRSAYTSKLVFSQMAMREFNRTLDALQADWLAYAREFVPDSIMRTYKNVK